MDMAKRIELEKRGWKSAEVGRHFYLSNNRNKVKIMGQK